MPDLAVTSVGKQQSLLADQPTSFSITTTSSELGGGGSLFGSALNEFNGGKGQQHVTKVPAVISQELFASSLLQRALSSREKAQRMTQTIF